MPAYTTKETVCLDRATADELASAAETTLASKSTIVRQALREWLDRQRRRPEEKGPEPDWAVTR